MSSPNPPAYSGNLIARRFARTVLELFILLRHPTPDPCRDENSRNARKRPQNCPMAGQMGGLKSLIYLQSLHSRLPRDHDPEPLA